MTTIQATESLIQLSLDTQRNLLIVFDLRATLATLSVSLSTFFTSIYGMNLLSGFEEDKLFMFNYTVGVMGIGVISFLIGIWRVQRARKWDVGVAKWFKTKIY
jgi:magnesium transporter